jgi:hypothetical protein
MKNPKYINYRIIDLDNLDTFTKSYPQYHFLHRLARFLNKYYLLDNSECLK